MGREWWPLRKDDRTNKNWGPFMSSDIPSWYIAVEGKPPNGPFTAKQVIEGWQAGRVDAATLCWREGMPQWLPLARVGPFVGVIREPGAARSARWRVSLIASAVAAILAVVCLTVFLVASSLRSSKIVGKWQGPDARERVGYYRDGTFRLFRYGAAAAGLYGGTWALIGDGRLRMEWRGRMEVLEVSFGKDTMALKRPDGSVTSYKRVPTLATEDGPHWLALKIKPSEISIDLGHDVKLELVLIPAGSFMMGEEREEIGEKPAHRVTITKPFYLGKYEVSQEQWYAIMGRNPSANLGPDNPVDRVTWDDCQEFIKRLNEKHGGNGKVFRLPAEAEWEYACRAGSAGAWCFGDDEWQLGDYAWYSSNSYRETPGRGQTHAVGLKLPNAWGLYDMHGNVLEWCADWFDSRYYAISPADDPKGTSSNPMDPRYFGERHVLRGGSWCGAHETPSASRAAGDGRKVYTRRGEDDSDGVNGFRVARTK
jgi:formylglycine-generating enzyme required for sulfatase activity